MTTFETNALELKDLCKSYPGFSLDHLNLTLPSGCILGLIGENGAGKTTAIKLILDIIRKDSGIIRILGKDCSTETSIPKEEIGVVMDEVGFPECLTPTQIGLIMKDSFNNWDSSLYSQYLQTFHLPEKKEFGQFSKGMKMKLGIAVALSHHPKLLILDEATSGLDPVVRDEILDIFNDFTRDESHAILISSHIVSDLEKSVTISHFSIKENWFFMKKKTGSWKNMALSSVQRNSYRNWILLRLSESNRLLIIRKLLSSEIRFRKAFPFSRSALKTCLYL